MLVLRSAIKEDGIYKKRVTLPKTAIVAGSSTSLVGWASFLNPISEDKMDFYEETLIIMDSKHCQKTFEDFLKNDMLCAFALRDDFKIPCNIDGGGPLMRYEILMGFIIFGVGCGVKTFPGIFTDIFYHRRWIEQLQDEIEMNEHSHLACMRGRFYATGHPLAKHIVSIEHIKHPYIRYDFLCEGTIVQPNVVVTSANCLIDEKTTLPYDEANIWVIAGSANRYKVSKHLQIYGVQKIKLHDSYKYPSIEHNVALLLLKKNIEEDNEYVQRIQMATEHVLPGEECVTLVWNKTKQNDFGPEKLLYGELMVPNRTLCGDINKTMICVVDPEFYFERTCLNHNGAPLICNNSLVGLIATDYGCGEPKNLSLFTDLLYYQPWIGTSNASKLISSIFYLSLILFLFTFLDVVYLSLN